MDVTAVYVAKMQVQEASHRYAHYCDTGDIDRLVDLFAEDGILDESAIGSPIVKGRDALRAFFEMAMPRNTSMFHLAGNYLIDVASPDEASGTHWQLFEGIRADQPNKTRIIKGYFYEEFVRTESVWRIKLKRLGMLAPVQWSEGRENLTS